MNKQDTLCPCESGQQYRDCCKDFIEQVTDADTALALMRSRYTAFVQRDEDYLRYSWHPDTCPEKIRLNAATKWLGLKIINTTDGSVNDTHGQVEFVARSKNQGKASRLHEVSRFARSQGRWVYLDGEIS